MMKSFKEYLEETIRTYGPVGAGPGTGYAHTAAREGREKCGECGYPMQECCCEPDEKTMEEGRIKEIDLELQDYERMTPQQFKSAYGMHKAEWALKHMDLFKDKQIDFSGTSGFDFVKETSRMLELAGVADHKFNQEDDAYCEDQDAQVVAQKEIDNAIDDPMPGVHENRKNK